MPRVRSIDRSRIGAAWVSMPGVLVVLVALLLTTAMPAAGAPADRSTGPVFTLPPPFPPSVAGSSTVTRTDHGVSITFESSGLTPGHVVTLWLIVANDPQACEAGIPGLSRCGPGDHLEGRGELSVHHGTGRVVGDDGTVAIGAHLRHGDTSRALFEGEPGLIDPRGAEVILVLKTHGPRIPGAVADQFRTFAGGCADQTTPPGLTPNEALLGRPGDNDCAELQFSVHSPDQ
jgi:hypothetical protein